MLKDVRRFYKSSLLNKKHPNPIGCSPYKVKQLEKEMDLEFPLAFKEFLLWMGEDYNGCFQGTDVFARDVIENTEYVPELLEENSVLYSPNNPILCFYVHQGCQAAWFEVTSDQDPLVLFYDEGSDEDPERGKYIRTEGKFSQFLKELLNDYATWEKTRR